MPYAEYVLESRGRTTWFSFGDLHVDIAHPGRPWANDLKAVERVEDVIALIRGAKS